MAFQATCLQDDNKEQKRPGMAKKFDSITSGSDFLVSTNNDDFL